MRDRIGPLVANRLMGLVVGPPDPVRYPPEVVAIVDLVVKEFRRNFPDGLPPPPTDQSIVQRYMRRAQTLFDSELAGQFELGGAA